MKKKSVLIYISFMFIMVALGASDALRGIFAPIFQSHFVLNNSQLSGIVTASYLGNLIFLLVGGKVADRYPRKAVSVGVMGIWAASLLLYLLSDNYYCLLVGMFLSVGASTLMNTMMNIMTPALFAVAPGMIINTLFFVQGIGTTGGQRLVGKYAQNFEAWKMVNAILLVLGLVGTLLFILIKFSVPRQKPPEKAEANSFKQVLSNPAFFWLTCILGLYFIAEHGMMNWFMNYAVKQFQFSTDEASVYLALFFGGMTVGRLVFSPLVHRWGMKKSIFIFGGTGSVCYALGAFGGEPTLGVLAFAGILLSIIYPTFVMMLQGYYKDSIVATATGMIISVATVFDILFNAGYGKVVDILGLRYSFLILPAAVLLFFALLSLFFLRERKKTAIIK